MAQDVVVKESLDEALIGDGAALVQALDDAGWTVSAALWLYSPDASRWRLLIASPLVERHGPREAYAGIQRALNGLDRGDAGLALDDVMVVGRDHSLVHVLRTAIRTGPGPALSRVRFARNVIDGHFIDDALIYRIT